jgi:hypothetical protein
MEHLIESAAERPGDPPWETQPALSPEAPAGRPVETDFFVQVELPSARWLKQAIDA